MTRKVDGFIAVNDNIRRPATLDLDELTFPLTNTNAAGAKAPVGTVVVTEYGDGLDHITKIALTGFAVGLSGDNANLARGALIYTFPAGDIIVEDSHIDVGLTLADAIQTDTPEIGLGTVACAGEVQATLGAVGATAENIKEGVAVADVAGTKKVSTAIPTAAVPLVIAAASAHTVNLNVADGWADLTGPAAITADGSITIRWKSAA